MKTALLVMLCSFLNPMYETFAQHTYEELFNKAFIASDMLTWKKGMAQMEALPNINEDEELLRTYTFAQYGYAGYLWEGKKKDELKLMLNAMEENILKLQKMNPNNSEYLALHGALFGLKIQLNPWKAPSYGLKCKELIDAAIELDSLNAFAYTQKANMTYFMPAFIGGGSKNGIALLEHAIDLMDADTNIPVDDWNCMLAKKTLYNWYLEDKQINKAERIKNKIGLSVPSYEGLNK